MSVRRKRKPSLPPRSTLERAAVECCARLNPHCPCETAPSVCAAMVAAVTSAARVLLSDADMVRLLNEGHVRKVVSDYHEMQADIGADLR